MHAYIRHRLFFFYTLLRGANALVLLAVLLVRGMSSRVVASMLAASVLFGANGTLKEVFGADSSQVTIYYQR